jgi:predicted transcriptional regulator
VAEILASMPKVPKLAYNTILTIVQTMERKGWVKRDAREKAHQYRPALSQVEYRTLEIKAVLGRLFGGKSVSLAAHLIQAEDLSKTELKQIQKMIKDLE